MKHSLLILISFLLLPISVFGWEWTVKYDMKKSDGSYEFVELSVPKIKGFWKLPNQGGIWMCGLTRYEPEQFNLSRMTLQCRSKEDETILLTSRIICNNKDTKKNELGINYPSNSKGIPNTVIILECNS